MRLRQGRVQGRRAKSGQGNYGDSSSLADRLQDDLPMAATLVLLEAQHRDPGPPSVLGDARLSEGLPEAGLAEATTSIRLLRSEATKELMSLPS